MPSRKAVFIAATGQNVGKTTTCLGVYSGLMKRFPSVGFIKPVGQQHVEVEGKLRVDKDVVLFKERFGLKTPYLEMSPVLFPSGFTRDYLDGKVSTTDLEEKILAAFQAVSERYEYVLVEGTGHMGVGTILDLNNARVAKLLDLEVVIVVPGGIGSAFDDLALNRAMCLEQGVKIRGVILNRLRDEKRDSVVPYITKALERWNIPLIGCIPFNKFLSTLSMEDFENLFKSLMISGERYRYRHFENARLVTTASVDEFMRMMIPNQLIITHGSREDIIQATLDKHRTFKREHPGSDLEGGMILTGRNPPRPHIVEEARELEVPIIYAPVTSFDAMRMISSYVGKIRNEDTLKVEKAIQLVENNINFEALCKTAIPAKHH